MDAFDKKNFLDRFAGTKQDASGYLDTNELERFLTDFILHRTGIPPTPEMLVEMRQNVLEEVDINKDGKIELGEFSKLLPVEENFMSKFSPRKTLSRKDFNEIFMHYDPDGNGFIEGKELLALIRDILSKSGGQTVTLQEVKDYQHAALQVFDKNTDRRLSRKELGLLLSIDR